MKLYFISSNKFKIQEMKEILESDNINIEGYQLKINEIQSEHMEEIVIDKARKAFQQIHRPIIVEQTGLYMPSFGNLPGGLTQVFWDSLEADKFSEFFGNLPITAKTIVAFCDGKQIKTFEGEIEGIVASAPLGNRDFQWDCIFKPNGYDKTFAEMGEHKNKISMRKIALENMKTYLEMECND